MDIFLVIIGFIFLLIGIAGSLVPVLPGPLASWLGLLLLYITKAIPTDWTFLGITLAIAIVVSVVDNIIPILGTKKFGGSKFGIVGATVGLVVGLFFGPVGIIAGPFLGAFIGEIIKDSKDSKKAFRAALGSFIGFLTSTLLKFIMSIIFTGLFIAKFWEYKAAFFSF
jgi:uncharacterized protein YqgC (DUF456 family)